MKRIQRWFIRERVKTCRCCAGEGLLWQIERRGEERTQWTGSIRNEFPEMATHGRAELAWMWEVGGCEAPARPAGQKERDRKTTERGGPRVLTGVALHSSWGLTADLDLGIFLPPPLKPHDLTLKSSTRHDTVARPLCYSSFALATPWATLHHSHDSSGAWRYKLVPF